MSADAGVEFIGCYRISECADVILGRQNGSEIYYFVIMLNGQKSALWPAANVDDAMLVLRCVPEKAWVIYGEIHGVHAQIVEEQAIEFPVRKRGNPDGLLRCAENVFRALCLGEHVLRDNASFG